MEFTITIQGRGGHGSRPDLACNPVDCFAAVFSLLQTMDCKIRWVDGGTASNIIPDQLHFGGSCKKETWTQMQASVEATCKNYHCNFLCKKEGSL